MLLITSFEFLVLIISYKVQVAGVTGCQLPVTGLPITGFKLQVAGSGESSLRFDN
jgi:hypothetical protein